MGHIDQDTTPRNREIFNINVISLLKKKSIWKLHEILFKIVTLFLKKIDSGVSTFCLPKTKTKVRFLLNLKCQHIFLLSYIKFTLACE